MGSLLPVAILVTNVPTVHMRLAHQQEKTFQSGVQSAMHRWKRRETSGDAEHVDDDIDFYPRSVVCAYGRVLRYLFANTGRDRPKISKEDKGKRK